MTEYALTAVNTEGEKETVSAVGKVTEDMDLGDSVELATDLLVTEETKLEIHKE